ncbi:restriction endonuclease subunit S [Anaerobiospirillum succiniciproducens]|uniref:restriction endonuclease subunit S n=1 Tax=Anaerobiospirillum succiniciproducens TaxID=13335 RepID=UPI003F8C630C
MDNTKPKLSLGSSTWTNISLDSIGEIRTGSTPKIKDIDNVGGPYCWVTPTDINGKEIDTTNIMLSEKGLKSARVIPANSLLVTCIASIGKNCILRSTGSCNQQINALTPNSNYDLDFLYYLLCNKEHVLHNNAGHGGMEILNKTEFSKLVFKVPKLKEQQKIAEFLTALDQKIRIHEQKLTKLISAKDSILRKLFKQEIRLKDKDGSDFNPWIKVKIGDILKVKHGKDYKHLSPGKIPVMATSGAISYVDTALCTWPCALIGRKGTIDKPQFMDKPFWCIDTLFYTKALGNHSPLFQYYLFQTIDWKKFNEGTGLPSLSASTIESIQCSIPMEKEQHEIANFLRIYDEKVKICTKKIEALKQLKKAFMQRMFV